MIRKSILVGLALVSISASAQAIKDGFYRIQNYGSKRYVYVYDNTGSINIPKTTADLGALLLDPTPEKRLHDPASVMYITNYGNGIIDLESQDTGVYKIINHYCYIMPGNVQDTYWVYATQGGISLYLWDGRSSLTGTSSMTTKERTNGNLRNWSILPVNSTGDEYLGISPTIQANGKYYKPYYVAFAMDFASQGMKAYYVSDVKSDAVIISEVTGTIPAGTPVIVECSSADVTNNRVNLYRNTPAQLTNNRLSGNYFSFGEHGETGYKVYDKNTMRVLAVKNGKLQYITDTDNSHIAKIEFPDGFEVIYKYCLNANESYLTVPAGTAADLPVMTQAEYDALHPTTKPGDVNGDGKINSTDIAVLYSYIAAGKTAVAAPLGDVNADGKINSTDIAVLYSFIAAGK